MNFVHDIDSIKRITVRIFLDGRQSGTGCLVWSGGNEKLYCITAGHCIKSESNRTPDIKIKSDDKSIEYQYTDVICNDTTDIVIFEIVLAVLMRTPPDVDVSSYMKDKCLCYIVGYPKIYEEKVCTVRAEFNHQNTQQIVLNLKDYNEDTEDRLDNIRGISGGSCFAIIGNKLSFIGIEQNLPNTKMPFNEVICASINVINELLSKNDWPLLRRPTPSYIFERIGSYSTVMEVLYEKEFINPLVETNVSQIIRDNIQNHFQERTPDSNVLCICGQSGIGKTKSVLEACRNSPNTVYYSSYDRFSDDISKIKRHSKDTSEPFDIIVDEVKFEDSIDINREFYNTHNIKIVLIVTMPKESYNNQRNIIYVDQCTENEFKEIISEACAYPYLSNSDTNAIYQLSYNDLRLALLLTEIYINDKDNLRDGNITNISGSQMQTEYRTARSILHRKLKLHEPYKCPRNLDLSAYYEKLSLFVDIGFKYYPVNCEITALAKFFGDNESDYKSAIDNLAAINLGSIKESYFEAVPRALARLAFEQRGWVLIKYRLTDFISCLNSLSSDMMAKRFYDRVDECANAQIKKEVDAALSAWFHNEYDIKGLASLYLPDSAKRAMMFIKRYPEIGLNWLKSSILSASDDELKRFGAGFCGRGDRRAVVWICERLANFREYFFDCEAILFKLAKNECEIGISNNSQGVWSEYFSMLFASTEVPFSERVKVLFDRLCNYKDDDNTEMFDKAFASMFNEAGAMLVIYPDMIGGKMTPERWRPQNYQDVIEAKMTSLNYICNSLVSITVKIRNIITNQLIKNIYSFFLVFDEYKNTLNKLLCGQDEKNQLIEAIDRQIRNGVHGDAELLQMLNTWRDELRDNSLFGRIVAYLSRDIWSYGYNDTDKAGEEALVNNLSKELINEMADNIEILKSIISYKNILAEPVQRFAEYVSQYDKNETIAKFLPDYFGLNSGKNFVCGYFTGIVNRYEYLPDSYIEMLDRFSEHNPDFVLWASAALDVSQRGYNRILSIINRESELYYLDHLRYKKWSSLLSEGQKVEITSKIYDLNKKCLDLCFELLQAWVSQASGRGCNILYEYAMTFLEQCEYKNNIHSLNIVFRILKALPKDYENRTIRFAASLFYFNTYDVNNGYAIEYLYEIKEERNESFMIESLGERLLATSDELNVPIHGLFDRFSVKEIMTWVDNDPEVRAELVDFYLLSPSMEEYKIVPLTEQLLTKYGGNNKVYRNFERSRHNFIPYSVDELNSRKDITISILNQYKEKCPIRRISEWADYEIAFLDDIAKSHNRLHADADRRKD